MENKNNKEEENGFFTFKEAAQYFRISTKTLRHLVNKEHAIDVLRPSGKFGRALIPIKAIRNFIESHTKNRGKPNG